MNAKLKRWKSYIEEHNHEFFYKKGVSNIVADALSRIKTDSAQINSLTPTLHSAENDVESYIPSTESPINVFKNQILLQINNTSSYSLTNLFGTHTTDAHLKLLIT